MTVVAEQFAESRSAMGGVFRSPALRRINLALVGSVIGDWAFSVAFAVYVYQNGGATALGVISVVRYLSMAVLASILSVLADKVDRRGLMIAADGISSRAGVGVCGDHRRGRAGHAGVRVVGAGRRRRA